MPVLPQNRVTAAARKREEDEAANYGCSLFEVVRRMVMVMGNGMGYGSRGGTRKRLTITIEPSLTYPIV